jgi:hypothetical protein
LVAGFENPAEDVFVSGQQRATFLREPPVDVEPDLGVEGHVTAVWRT